MELYLYFCSMPQWRGQNKCSSIREKTLIFLNLYHSCMNSYRRHSTPVPDASRRLFSQPYPKWLWDLQGYTAERTGDSIPADSPSVKHGTRFHHTEVWFTRTFTSTPPLRLHDVAFKNTELTLASLYKYHNFSKSNAKKQTAKYFCFLLSATTNLTQVRFQRILHRRMTQIYSA